MQFSIRVSIVRNLLTLAGLVLAPSLVPYDCAAQVLQNQLPTPLRSLHDLKQDYIWDKPFQYSPSDPFERGKVYRMHTGQWGNYYNCDGEEAKRCSPYIYWKMNDKPALPGRLGLCNRIRCEWTQVKQRVMDGSCRDCEQCGQAGCTGSCAASSCRNCRRPGCRGCRGNTAQAQPAGVCSDGNCGSCRECSRQGKVKKVASRPKSRCVGGNCGGCTECALRSGAQTVATPGNDGCAGGNCGQCSDCASRSSVQLVGSHGESGCAGGNCGQCSKCALRNTVQNNSARTRTSCASGDCGKCRKCSSNGLVGDLFARRRSVRCDCAPEGFRGGRKACAREGCCGCVDTSLDAMAPAGLISYIPDPAATPPNVISKKRPESKGPIKSIWEFVQAESDGKTEMDGDSEMKPQASVTANHQSSEPQANLCNCAQCKLARIRSDLEQWNAEQSERTADASATRNR